MPLPLDVVNAVLEAGYLYKGRPDYKTLGTCALVCKAWAAHAQRLHYRWLSVRSADCASALASRVLDVDTRRARALKSCVRIVELGPAVEPEFACDALARCEFAYELRLDTLSDDLPPRLGAAGAGLRTLRLAAPSSRALRALLAALPALTRVEAALQRFEPDEDAADEWPLRAGQLRELRLAAEQVAPDARPALEALVAAAAGPALEALSLAAPDFCPPLAEDALCGLRSLGIDRWDDGVAGALAALPALRELLFWAPAVVRSSDALVDALPPRLVHLAVPGGDAFTADRLQRESAAIPRLRARLPCLAVVTVYATSPAALGTWARMLVAWCDHLRIRRQLRSDKEMLYETDLIPCTAFPRYREAANYSYMAPVAALPASVEDLVSTLPMTLSQEGEEHRPPSLAERIVLESEMVVEAPPPPNLPSVPLPALEEDAQETPVRSKSRSVRSRLRRVMLKLKVILPRPVRSRA